MLRSLSFVALAVAAVAGIGYADQPTSAKVAIPVTTTAANSGKQMFENYCAPCHGVDAKGQGPISAALKKQPADLTLLSKKNGGKFPSSHVRSVLEFGTANPSHGTAAMPIWGPLLGKLDSTADPHVTALRIDNLSRYLESLQAK